jgi:hypothetical protein
MNFYEELVALIVSLDEARIDYAICGGVALAIHGHPRFTKDIDLVVQAEDVDRIQRVVAERGFTLPALPMTFDAGSSTERRVHRLSKIDEADLLTLDLLVLRGPAFRGVWDDREEFAWRERSVRAVSRQGLITMKRAAGRPQDLVDIDLLENADARR